MKLARGLKWLPVSDIQVQRDERQRREIDTSGLIDSIRLYGVLNPIIVDAEGVLIAGERRLESCRQLGLSTIPARHIEDLDPTQRQIIELEENAKRLDLPWQDLVRSTAKIHELYSSTDPTWSRAKTAEALSITTGSLTVHLTVAANLSNPRIANADGMRAAYNVLMRAQERAASDALNELTETMQDLTQVGSEENNAKLDSSDSPSEANHPHTQSKEPSVRASSSTPSVAHKHGSSSAEESILLTDFATWVETYSGPKFNFLHCDFPYGINVFGGDMSGRKTQQIYSDEKDIYWNLIETLCKNLDKILTPSAHLMFWLSPRHTILHRTLELFRQLAPDLEFWQSPLIWLKSDNVGILQDPKRGPRNTIEMALFASREDRLIVKPVANAYSAPTDKRFHPSTKPEPVLKHFFQMFVDEHTTMLDPTCGSGSALRAAEHLGARRTLGLERDPEFHKSACDALRSFRLLRAAS